MAQPKCLFGSNEKKTFDDFIKSCGDFNDQRRVKDFFKNSTYNVIGTFQLLRGEFDDLITSMDSINNMRTITQNTDEDIKARVRALEKKKENLLEEIKKNRLISESADKAFLEDIMHKVPQKELTPSLQDGALAFFWFGWFMMVLTLTYVRWFSPGGNAIAGLVTLLILLIISVCVYGLLMRVA